MNLKPLDDRIVVKPSEAVQTTASGLVIPDTAKEKPQQGTVLAVGPTTFLFSPAATYSQLLPDFLTISLQHAKDQNKHGQAIEV